MSQSTDVDDFWHLPPDRSAPKYLVRFAIITRTRLLSRLRDDSIGGRHRSSRFPALDSKGGFFSSSFVITRSQILFGN